VAGFSGLLWQGLAGCVSLVVQFLGPVGGGHAQVGTEQRLVCTAAAGQSTTNMSVEALSTAEDGEAQVSTEHRL
jgi:hypothetical protein